MVIIDVIIVRTTVARDADKNSVRAADATVGSVMEAAESRVAVSTSDADRTLMISTVVLAGGRSVEAPSQPVRVRKESPRATRSAAMASR